MSLGFERSGSISLYHRVGRTKSRLVKRVCTSDSENRYSWENVDAASTHMKGIVPSTFNQIS